MAKNDENTAVLEKPRKEKPVEAKEPTAEKLEKAFQDEGANAVQSLERDASRISAEADKLAEGKEDFDPTLKESLVRNAAEAQQLPPRFKDRIRAIEQSSPAETEENIEQYVLDAKESGSTLERENIAEYQETLKTMYEWTPNEQEQAEMQDSNAEPLSEEETQFHLSIIEARMRKTAVTEDVLNDQLAHLEDVAKRAREAAIAKNESKPEGQKLNVRALELAALYHDCSKHTENKRDTQSGKELNQSNDDLLGHSFHSAIDVGKTLRKVGNIPEGVIKHIEQMILTHSSEEFPEIFAKKHGKAKELGQGQEAGDFYLMQPKDESAELLRSADLSNGASIESYKKYFPAHFTNKEIFDGNIKKQANKIEKKYFDIAFDSFLESTKNNIDGMKDEAVRNTSGAKEEARSKFLAEDFFNRPEIQSRVKALRVLIEKITTKGDERVMPAAKQLQEVKQKFDALIDAAVRTYNEEKTVNAVAA